MSFTALEISLNGERMYTVGIDEWQTIWAHVLGHRIDPAIFAGDPNMSDAEQPDSPVSMVNFRASVSVPTPHSERMTDSEGRTYNSSKTGSYQGVTLSPGDVVQIRVIETDSADTPQWEERDPRFPHGSVFLPKSDPEYVVG